MSVYVTPDDDFKTRVKKRQRGGGEPHTLWADSAEELDAMAQRLGLRRSGRRATRSEVFSGGRFVHYLLSPSRRARAVRLGAVEMHPLEYIINFEEDQAEEARG